jgi:hypothetical protein
VKAFDGATTAVRLDFDVFPPGGWTSGLRVAVAPLTADGVSDLIVVPGPGQASEVKVLDGLSLSTVDDFFANGAAVRGLFVAGG